MSDDVKESFIHSSIWQLQQGKATFIRSRTRCVLQLLLLLAGDIETCPGPRGIRCPSCLKCIRKNQSSAACFNCKLKSHLKCMTDRFADNAEELYCSTCSVNKFPDLRSEIPDERVHEELDSFCSKNRGLKLFHRNINGLLGKMEKVRLLLTGTRRNIHVYGLTETHLHRSVLDDELYVDGYTLERADRSKGHYGGVLCYIRNDIQYQRRRDLESPGLEAIFHRNFHRKNKIHLAVFCL